MYIEKHEEFQGNVTFSYNTNILDSPTLKLKIILESLFRKLQRTVYSIVYWNPGAAAISIGLVVLIQKNMIKQELV